MNLLKNKFEFMWQKKIPPSEFDKMDFWEFEIFIQLMNERNKEENKKNKEQEEQQLEFPFNLFRKTTASIVFRA